jgi:hypothetical protein
MTIPASGPIGFNQINLEDGLAELSQVSLNDVPVRSLAGKVTGTIGVSDLVGKSGEGALVSYYFNGSNNGIRIADSTQSGLYFGTSDYTIEFWMKANTQPDVYSTILDSSNNNTGIAISLGAYRGISNKLTFWSDSSGPSITTANVVTDNTWHHIAAVKYANTGFLFVDGTIKANTRTGAWSTVTNAYIADGEIGRSRYGNADGSDNKYKGWLSNLRVTKRALYTQNFTPPARTLSPIPDTKLLTLKDSLVADVGGNAYTLSANSALPYLSTDVLPPITPTFPFTIASNITNANVYNLAKTAGWDANNGLVVATINSGVIVSSSSTGAYAMEVNGGFYGGVKIVNNGLIVGRGGDGASGGTAYAYNSGYAGNPGSGGGPALLVGVPASVKNLGTIAGGGGGGGGGGATGGVSYYTYVAGYSYPNRAYYATGTYYYTTGGGGGGGGIGGSAGGGGGGAASSNYPAVGAAGAAGSTTSPGGGGAGGALGFTAGSGAAGGTYGSSGGTGSSGNGNIVNYPGGSGGGGGTAIQGYSKISWQAFGTIYGATGG